jgi:hypothetical protein
VILPVQVAVEDVKLTVLTVMEAATQEAQVTLSLNQGVQTAVLMQRMLEGNAWRTLKLMQDGTLLQPPAMVGIQRAQSTLSASIDTVILVLVITCYFPAV